MTKVEICDDCTMLAYDEGFDQSIMAEIGAEIEDHRCINHDEPELVKSGDIPRCECACSNQ